MQYVIIAHDAKDKDALERRAAARPAHLEMIDDGVKTGQNLLGAALLNDEGQMCGSCMVVDFPTRAALDNWLKNEPFVTGDVWKDIQILPCKLAPSFEKLLKK